MAAVTKLSTFLLLIFLRSVISFHSASFDTCDSKSLNRVECIPSYARSQGPYKVTNGKSQLWGILVSSRQNCGDQFKPISVTSSTLRAAKISSTSNNNRKRFLKKFVMCLFKILMAPWRMLRSSCSSSSSSSLGLDKSEMEMQTLEPENKVRPSEEDVIIAIKEPPLLKSLIEETTLIVGDVSNPTSKLESAESESILESSRAIMISEVPQADRWATAAVDLSGDWVLMASDDFKAEYDEYLKRLGQPMVVRGIALGIIGLTSEYTLQSEEGRKLFIRGINARGIWERTLITSGADSESTEFQRETVSVVTADDETVQAESWWEENGTVHRSWMRGVTKYGGGDFESKRYLEGDNKSVLVCETVFHPKDSKREPAKVTWKFLRKSLA